METTLLLATMAQRFQLRMVPDHPVIPVPSFTLRPKHGMKMTLTAPASAGAQAAAVRSTNVG